MLWDGLAIGTAGTISGSTNAFGALAPPEVGIDDARLRSPLAADALRLVSRERSEEAAVGEEPDTVEDVVEPYLLQLGFLQRTPRGRVATERAYRHLGEAPAGQLPL